jgi:hypothetical protein
LTNEGVVLLAEAGLAERFLLELIEQKNTRFDTVPRRWLRWRGRG